MAFWRGAMIGKALSGLLILALLALPAARAGIGLPLLVEAAAHAVMDGHEGRNMTAAPAQDHSEHQSGVPCDGDRPTHGLTCCVCGACSVPIGYSPSAHPSQRPRVETSLVFPMPAPLPPKGFANAPDLPPPRQIV